MAIIDIKNVINVSLTAPLSGLAGYDINNVLMLTKDTPVGTIGDYKAYISVDEVLTDWGINSKVYSNALSFFAQSPNAVSGNGRLIVAPSGEVDLDSELILSNMSDSDYDQQYSIVTGVRGQYSSGDSLFTPDEDNLVFSFQDGLSWRVVAKDSNTGDWTALTTSVDPSTWVLNTNVSPTVQEAITSDSETVGDYNGPASSDPKVDYLVPTRAETITESVARIKGLVYFGGFGWDFAPADLAEATDAMTWAQANQKICGVNSNLSTDMNTGELLAYPEENGLFYTRPFFYSVDSEKASEFMWGYLSRAMSVIHSGSNTTLTMNLKQISGVAADSGLTQTLLDTAKGIGADVYADIAGRASVLSHGENQFFDSVYNSIAFKGDIEVGGFNYLAQTTGKVPQTEAGMSGLKGAYREVCDRYVNNGFIAPGEWNGPVPFGNSEDFLRNIRDFGYYIYSIPVAQQAQNEREQRIAPLVQIAVKEAGAIHSSNVIILVQP